MYSPRIPELMNSAMERIARVFGRGRGDAAHLKTGRKGEDVAFYFLRRNGYTIVARNWRAKGRRGEVDLIGWGGKTLCFIEVKTRSGRGIVPAEMAVDGDKQRELRGMAALFLRTQRVRPSIRFDVVSVYAEPGKRPEVELFKDAFTKRSMSAKRYGF